MNCGLPWKGPPHRVSACSASVCVRVRGQAAFETLPWVISCDCDERRIHRGKPEVARGSRRDGYQSTTAACCQSPDLPKARPIWRLCAVRLAEVGCEAGA